MSEKNDRTTWRLESEFMCTVQLQNSIPTVACGNPMSRNIEVDPKFNDMAVYRESALEKNYIWQPHLGLNVGLTFDFVDQEALTRNEPVNPAHINEDDRKILHHTTKTHALQKVRTKNITDDLPWWMRNPVYLENNLYEVTNNFKTGGSLEIQALKDSKYRRKLEQQYGSEDVATNMGGVFSKGYADKSFEDVVALERKVVAQSKSGKRGASALEYSIPVVPHEESLTRSYSLVRYEEDPMGVRAEIEDRELTAVDAKSKRLRMRHSVAMNSRPLQETKSGVAGIGAGKASTFAISVVAPSVTIIPDEKGSIEKDNGDSDDLFGDDDDDENQDSGDGDASASKDILAAAIGSDAPGAQGRADKNGTPAVLDSEPYTWVKDFKSEVKSKNSLDTFAIFITDPSENDSSAKIASFLPLRSQIAMTKLPYVDKSSLPVPQEVALLRKSETFTE